MEEHLDPLGNMKDHLYSSAQKTSRADERIIYKTILIPQLGKLAELRRG